MRWLLLVLLLLSIGAGGRVPPPELLIVVDRSEYKLRFYRDGDLVLTSKVIIGRPDRATPEMETEIRHIIFNPYWNLSPKLARDILPHQSNISMARRGYEFVEGWVVDAPLTSQEPMKCVFDGTCRMRQRPGPANFLGRVKFSMPNEHDIYIHDTPARHLFDRERREFSSGCIRAEKSLELAEAILGRPVASYTMSWERHEVYLPKPVKVIVR